MHSYLDQQTQSIRQISDLRFGIPIIIGNDGLNALVFSIETLTTSNFKKIEWNFSEPGYEAYISLTKNRANLLKIRVYEEDIARIKMPREISLDWIKATADPALDLDYPMKGPYESYRDGNGDIARIGIKFCKEAELLPAVLVLPITERSAQKFMNDGLLYQNISESVISKASKWEATLISSGFIPISNQLSSKVSVFRHPFCLSEHYAIEIGTLDYTQPILTRIHSACFTGDLLHSLKCDCGDQLAESIAQIKEARKGVILYLNQEGRGIGLANKMRAYKLQDSGLDTFDANHQLGFEDDERDLSVGAKILMRLGIRKINLLTNNPSKIYNMENHGIKVVRRIPLITKITAENKKYLKTKKEKSGHILFQN
jgi:GTP cyclohydrolase II